MKRELMISTAEINIKNVLSGKEVKALIEA